MNSTEFIEVDFKKTQYKSFDDLRDHYLASIFFYDSSLEEKDYPYSYKVFEIPMSIEDSTDHLWVFSETLGDIRKALEATNPVHYIFTKYEYEYYANDNDVEPGENSKVYVFIHFKDENDLLKFKLVLDE